jgi:hypothetical protein
LVGEGCSWHDDEFWGKNWNETGMNLH